MYSLQFMIQTGNPIGLLTRKRRRKLLLSGADSQLLINLADQSVPDQEFRNFGSLLLLSLPADLTFLPHIHLIGGHSV